MMEVAQLDVADARVTERHSARRFMGGLATVAQLSKLLDILRRHSYAGGYKYNYASAGALYPVRTYLHVRKPVSFGVADFAGGAYQYQPADHQLVMISGHAPYDRALHAPINRPVFEQSAFSFFFFGVLVVFV